ncbi:MAG: hypothetical protein Q8R76_03445 [Candidatus Omnitrophota bacterium]|nr:hypothetical protein [Candidatus Omnitrophota bacterium]
MAKKKKKSKKPKPRVVPSSKTHKRSHRKIEKKSWIEEIAWLE